MATRTRAREVGDVAVLVGLHARGARRDPAAERRVGEAVGEVAERPAAGVELAPRGRGRRSRPARARAGSAGSISSTRSRRPMSTDTTVRGLALAGASRLPEMFVPPPNGITTASASSAALRTAVTAASSPGRTTTSGTRPMSPRRWRTRSRRLLPRAWPTRSAGSVERCGRADGRLERGVELGRQSTARGSRGRSKRSARVTTRVDVELQVVLDERPQRRLVGVAEAHALDAPAPPLHRGRGRAARRAGAWPLAPDRRDRSSRLGT